MARSTAITAISFDDVSRFPNWPKPFVEQNGQRYIVKPWGENMVQRFYNQYEAAW